MFIECVCTPGTYLGLRLEVQDQTRNLWEAETGKRLRRFSPRAGSLTTYTETGVLKSCATVHLSVAHQLLVGGGSTTLGGAHEETKAPGGFSMAAWQVPVKSLAPHLIPFPGRRKRTYLSRENRRKCRVPTRRLGSLREQLTDWSINKGDSLNQAWGPTTCMVSGAGPICASETLAARHQPGQRWMWWAVLFVCWGGSRAQGRASGTFHGGVDIFRAFKSKTQENSLKVPLKS